MVMMVGWRWGLSLVAYDDPLPVAYQYSGRATGTGHLRHFLD